MRVGGGATKEAFKEALWEMRELFGPKVISVKVDRREIARAVATDEAWSR